MARKTINPHKFNGKLLSKLLTEKMIKVGNGKILSLDKTEVLVGCSKTCIDRAKKGVLVDPLSLFAICVWLNKSMGSFFINGKK